ncbi:MAG TPA: efflux RND transporter periplasmic adaptor subunit [Casimicrobiaceae bacterium]|nr:efflux RND transporter periplasmic adaptor subunit [Casimicrobiaceae bacterium]
MTTKNLVFALVAAAVIGAFGYGAYRVGINRGMQMSNGANVTATQSTTAAQKPGDIDPATGKKVLYWHDPMVPGQKFDKPGKSPFMDMQLVPMYADGGNDEGTVAISSRVQQNLGMRVAEVKPGSLTSTVEAVGSVAYNERDVAVVQARSNGFLERLHVRAPLDPVRKGQPLAELYIPDWVAAQEEYLTAKRISAQSTVRSLAGLDEGARQRMRLAGMNDNQIAAVEASGKVQTRVTITAPIGGVVGEINAREGMTVMAGAPLFRLNGLSTVWVNAELPETLAAQVRPGNPVEARTPALPGAVFNGKVSAIVPEVNAATRTIKARIELANPQGQLVPGMFATVNFTPQARKEVLLVPSEAVIQTGKRSVVVVAQGDGKFASVDVEVGLESNGQTEIRKGLQAGQKVVVSGQFLVDSEANLKAAASRMDAMPASDAAGAGNASTKTHRGEGKVESIGREEITISHGPIATLQWGPMTMGFKLPATGVPKGIAVGDTVAFEIRPIKEGAFEITSMAPAQAKTASPVGGAIKGPITKAPGGVGTGTKP